MKKSIAILLFACALSALHTTVNANQKHVTEIGFNQAAEMQSFDFNHDVYVIEALPKMEIAVVALEYAAFEENSTVAVKFIASTGNNEKKLNITDRPVRLIPWRTGADVIKTTTHLLLHKNLWLTNCTIKQC